MDRGTDAENYEQGDVDGRALEIDGSTTEPGGQRLGTRVGNELKTRIDQIELDGFVVRDSGFYIGSQSSIQRESGSGRERLTFEEESCLVGNQVTGEVLRRVHQVGDDRSPQIGALHKVEEGRGAAHLSFDLHGSLHHGK